MPRRGKACLGAATDRGRVFDGYRLVNHGYFPPDRCIWWEAHNIATGEADFRAHTRRELKAQITAAKK